MSPSADSVRQWARLRFPEIVFLAVTTGAGLWAAGRWMDPIGDTGFNWSLAYRLSHGERLYRDIYFAYGPLSPYLLALWARLFGVSSFSLLVANWIPAILAGLLVLRAARRFLSPFERIGLIGMMLATSIFAPGAGRLVFPYYVGVVHALVFGLGALLFLEAKSPSSRARLLAGAVAGLAFCCKQEIGVAVLAALLVSILVTQARPIRGAATVLGGFSIVALAAAIFAALSAPVESLRDRSHLWPLNPLPPAELNLLYRTVSGLADPGWFFFLRASVWSLLAGVALLAALGGLLSRERSAAAWCRLLYLAVGLAVWEAVERFPLRIDLSPIRLWAMGAFLVAALAFFQRALEGRASLIAFGLFAGLTGLRTVFSPFVSGGYDGPAHFLSALTWALLLISFVPRLLWTSARATTRTRLALTCVLLLLFWWDAASGVESLRSPSNTALSTPAGRVFLERGQAAFLQRLGQNLRAGERVLVLPDINAVDALYEVRSACPLLNYFPAWVDADLEAELIRSVERDPPSHVILFRRTIPDFPGKPFGEGYGVEIAKWCMQRYRVVYSSPKGMILKPREETNRDFEARTPMKPGGEADRDPKTDTPGTRR
jgi:hypothetical protein